MNNLSLKLIAILMCVCMLACMGACKNNPVVDEPTPSANETPEPTDSPAPTEAAPVIVSAEIMIDDSLSSVYKREDGSF